VKALVYLPLCLVLFGISSAALPARSFADSPKTNYRVHLVIVADCSPGAWPTKDDDTEHKERRLGRIVTIQSVVRMLALLAENVPDQQLDVVIVEPPSLSEDRELDELIPRLKPMALDNLFKLCLKEIGITNLNRRPVLSTDGVLAAIESLSVDENDVIWFYYSGHGTHVVERDDHALTMFPNKNAARFATQILYRKTLRDAIAAKKPRLAVLLTDCCYGLASINQLGEIENEKTFKASLPLAGDAPARPEKISRVFQFLLMHGGVVDMTGSRKGELSWWFWPTPGQLFTSSFVGYLTDKSKKNERVSWNAIQRDVATQVEEVFKAGKARNPELGAQQGTQLPLTLIWPSGGARFGARAKTTPERDGVTVLEVVPGTPAEEAQLKTGDVIVTINDQNISDQRDYSDAVDKSEPAMRIRVRRGAAIESLEAKLPPLEK
jgi:hypothetical protein